MQISSFKYAFSGIIKGIKKENNFRTMFFCFLLVIAANIVLNVTKLDWIITLMCSGAVLSVELVNSALEKNIDYSTEEHHPLLADAKDYTAGAALVMSIISFVIALIVYIPYLKDFFVK